MARVIGNWNHWRRTMEIRRIMIGVALATGVTWTTPALPARADDAKPPDLTGEWRLDARHSDSMQRPEGGGRGGWGGGGGGGGRRGGGGWGGGGEGGGGMGGGGSWGGGGGR